LLNVWGKPFIWEHPMFARLVAASFAIVLAFLALPALAQSASTPVPEPTDLALFALGVAGLVIGRHVARKKD
jgi:hypothetical protein